ncbi:hypothetical protein ABH940_005267 [Streptacidiphilus sp. BW17]
MAAACLVLAVVHLRLTTAALRPVLSVRRSSLEQ